MSAMYAGSATTFSPRKYDIGSPGAMCISVKFIIITANNNGIASNILRIIYDVREAALTFVLDKYYTLIQIREIVIYKARFCDESRAKAYSRAKFRSASLYRWST